MPVVSDGLPVDTPSHAAAVTAPLDGGLRHWALVAGRFASVQALVQIIGFSTGLLIIRGMGQREYGLYTIASAMQGTMNLLADMGVGIGVLALGGKVWADRRRLGEVVQTALRLRYLLAAGCVLVVAPITLYLLLRQGVSWTYALTLLAIVLAGLAAQVTAGVLAVVPRLHSQIGRLQRLDLGLALIRALGVALVFTFCLNAATALLIATAAVFLQGFFLRRWTGELLDFGAGATTEARRHFLRIVRSQAPNAIFFCFQGQISIWLISTFGNAKGIAEVGALGRLVMLFSVIGSVMTGVVVPRFARCQNFLVLWRRYAQIVAICVALSICLVAAAVLLAPQFLWLLGHQYAHLHSEFVLMVFSAVLTFVTATLWSLNSSRAWIQYSWVYIPGTLAAQIVLLKLLDLSSVWGVLFFGLLSQIPSLLLNIFLSWRGFKTERNAVALASA